MLESVHLVRARTGSHTIQVAAISPDGVGDPTPAVRTFSVNPSESHPWECHINPYTALSPYSTDPDGCEFATKALCAKGTANAAS